MRKLHPMIIAIVFVSVCLTIALGSAVAGPNTDPRCEGLSGAAFGLCTAATSVGCDDPEVTKPGCASIAEKFAQITGEEPPWTTPLCTDNSECSASEFCKKLVGDCVGFGVCTEKPIACPIIFFSVCGCDGATYSDAYCNAWQFGVNVDYEGDC